MNRYATLLTTPFLALALAFIAGCGKEEEAGGGPPQGGMVFPVTVAEVETGPIAERALVVGSIRWTRDVELKVETEGRLEQLAFREGESFKKGDVLAKIDDGDYQVAKQRHEANLQKAKRELDELKAGSRQEVLQRLKAEIAAAEADVMLAKDELRRSENLFKADVQTEAEVIRNRSAMASAEAMLEQTKARYAEAKAGARPEAIHVAEAEVAVHEAEIAVLEREIAKCTINAPFDGVVLAKYAEEGAYLQVANSLLMIASTEDVEAIMGVSENHVNHIPAGATFTLTADAYPDKTFDAEVIAVIPLADARSRNIRVRAKVINPRGLLVAGMFVRTNVNVEEKNSTTIVPLDAITLRDDKRLIFTVNDDNTVEMLTVEIGLQNNTISEIISPELTPGTKVVTTGGEVLFPGASVKLPGQGGGPGGPGGKPTASE